MAARLKQQKNFSVFEIQENERKRIARDLHDTSLQKLTSLTYKLEIASMTMDKDITEAKLEMASIRKELKNVINEIRNTIFDMHPMTFDDLGFKDALENYFENVMLRYDIRIIYHVEDYRSEDTDKLLNIYRVIQECVSNAVKHSNAEKLVFDLKKEDSLIIQIYDNGDGFDKDSIMKSGVQIKHYGLHIIEERINLLSGQFNIESKIGEGTKIDIIIPI